jgi:hypothetical protein
MERPPQLHKIIYITRKPFYRRLFGAENAVYNKRTASSMAFDF